MFDQPGDVSIVGDLRALGSPTLAFFFQLWDRKRCGRTIPARIDVQPSDLKPQLTHALIMEALPGFTDFRFRLIGTGVAQHVLADATGKTLREMGALVNATDTHTDKVVGLYRKTCEDQAPLLIHSDAGSLRGKFYPGFDAIYLPLSDDTGSATFVLTACAFDTARSSPTGSRP